MIQIGTVPRRQRQRGSILAHRSLNACCTHRTFHGNINICTIARPFVLAADLSMPVYCSCIRLLVRFVSRWPRIDNKTIMSRAAVPIRQHDSIVRSTTASLDTTNLAFHAESGVKVTVVAPTVDMKRDAVRIKQCSVPVPPFCPRPYLCSNATHTPCLRVCNSCFDFDISPAWVENGAYRQARSTHPVPWYAM